MSQASSQGWFPILLCSGQGPVQGPSWSLVPAKEGLEKELGGSSRDFQLIIRCKGYVCRRNHASGTEPIERQAGLPVLLKNTSFLMHARCMHGKPRNHLLSQTFSGQRSSALRSFVPSLSQASIKNLSKASNDIFLIPMLAGPRLGGSLWAKALAICGANQGPPRAAHPHLPPRSLPQPPTPSLTTGHGLQQMPPGKF